MIPRFVASALVLALAGCGGSRATEADDATDTTGATDWTPETTTIAPSGGNGPGCPPAFSGPQPSCQEGDDPGECHYDEGDCYCGAPEICGGAARPPMPPVWICHERRVCGEPGTPCAAGSPPCGATCCGGATVCLNGVWTAQMVPCPP